MKDVMYLYVTGFRLTRVGLAKNKSCEVCGLYGDYAATVDIFSVSQI